jgi:ElaB/YqjD/DUF883 family membrane-anchored ribosome-binding protein
LIQRNARGAALPTIDQRRGYRPPGIERNDMDTPTSIDTSVDGRLAHNLRQLIEEAERLVRNAADSGDQRLDAMRGKFEHQLKRMRLQLDELEDTAAHSARQAARAANQAVQAHPYRAIGIAAAAGALIGLLFARR